ncbi:vacuolar sorting protein 39 [Wolffia australiana]
MAHSAFDAVEAVRGSPARIEVAGVHGSKILMGCSDCALRIYAPLQAVETLGWSAAHGKEMRKENYVLERTVSGFWRKSPVAMEVSKSRDLLLSLSEWIAFHRLPNLETVAVIGKTKGASVYSWDDHRGFLCVGRQKKVGIFRFDGRDFLEVKELGVPDVVKSMAWCGENICLGIKREYMILNSATGALSEVFPSGRIAPPLVIPLSSGDLILGKDNIGVFVDQNGKLSQDGRICWVEPPASVIIDWPYTIARLPKYLEIRSLRAPYPLVQTIYLRDIHILLESSGYVIAASGSSLYWLLPVPIDVQIVQLTASGDFEEALALCKLLPQEDSALRAAKEGSIHIRYAHSLFDKENYEEAMDQFMASLVDITYVLSLYPSIVLPKTTVIPDAEKLPDLSDVYYLSGASSDASDELEASPTAQFVDFDEKAALKAKKTQHNALMALAKYLNKKRYAIIERAVSEVTDEVVMRAVQGSSHKTNNLSKVRGSHHISSVARERASILDTALLQAIVLTGQSSGALEILKGPNYCDLKISEEFLLEKECHDLLLELYKSNQMHRDALKLLVQLVEESSANQSSAENPRNFKPDMVIDYLKPLCGSDPMLVLEFSMHVLDSCPTQAIELFLSENIPSDLVNSYLKQRAPNMQSKYLELMLSMNESGVSPNLQYELVQIYLSEVLDWFKDLNEQGKWDEKTYTPTRRKLLSALEGISENNSGTLIKRLPPNALYEEHAILLGRLNQHHLALSLYVHKLHLPELALSYCDRVYETDSLRKGFSIYLNLLQLYLNPRSSPKELEKRSRNLLPKDRPSQRVLKKVMTIESAEDSRNVPSSTDSGRSDCDSDDVADGVDHTMLNYALELLTQRWDRINGAQALRLLPGKTKLMNLVPFLEPLLRKSSEGRRNYSIIRNLRYSENLQAKEELLKQQKPGFKIDGDSTCSLCRKKIGTSVFVVYPNRKTLVHFVCFRESQRLRLRAGP